MEDNRNPNKHVADFLSYYCNPDNIHSYAVLLTGQWGVGKSHFIKQWLKSSERKHLFVTLNGVTSLRQIEEQFFQQMHPLLASKGMKIAGALLKGTLKATLKVNLDKTPDDDGSLTVQLPEADLANFFSDPRKTLLVFDDLERCSMSPSEVLGYIGGFVEQNGYKVIIVGNEAEIVGREEAASNNGRISKLDDEKIGHLSYSRIKEKVIGYTFPITSSLDTALPEFIILLRDPKVRTYLQQKVDLIKSIFRSCQKDNLRVLQQSLWDFERLGVLLSDEQFAHTELLDELLALLLSLSMELKVRRIQPNQLLDVFGLNVARGLDKKAGSEDEVDRLLARYEQIDFTTPVVGAEFVRHVLCEGCCDENYVRSEINKTRYFMRDDELPTWRRLLDVFRQTDDELANLIRVSEAEFIERKYRATGEILHIFGMRLFLARSHIIPVDVADVVRECRTYVEDLQKQGLLEPLADKHSVGIFDLTGFGGFGYTDRETNEFQDLYNYYQEARELEYTRRLPQRAKSLLNDLASTPDIFCRQLYGSGDADGTFSTVPVLKHIPSAQFAAVLLALPFPEIYAVLQTLKRRYDLRGVAGELSEEMPWLTELREHLLEVSKDTGPKARLAKLVEWCIDPSLKAAKLI